MMDWVQEALRNRLSQGPEIFVKFVPESKT